MCARWFRKAGLAEKRAQEGRAEVGRGAQVRPAPVEAGDEQSRGVCKGPPRWAKDPSEGSSRSMGPCSLIPAEQPVIPEASAWQVVGKNPCANCTRDPWEPPSNPD